MPSLLLRSRFALRMQPMNTTGLTPVDFAIFPAVLESRKQGPVPRLFEGCTRGLDFFEGCRKVAKIAASMRVQPSHAQCNLGGLSSGLTLGLRFRYAEIVLPG